MSQTVLPWMPYLLPFLFVGMWFLVTTMLGFISGWFNLQQWYPDDGNDEPLLKLKRQSGVMGAGVSLNRVLTLAACRSGLSMRTMRIFAPFQRPLLVPWREITAEPARMFFTPMVRLNFGNPPTGKLEISARTWSRLVEAARPVTGGEDLPYSPQFSRRLVAGRMALEWLTLTAILATFLLVIRQATPGGLGLPIALCVGLPAAAIGIGQIMRFVREG